MKMKITIVLALLLSGNAWGYGYDAVEYTKCKKQQATEICDLYIKGYEAQENDKAARADAALAGAQTNLELQQTNYNNQFNDHCNRLTNQKDIDTCMKPALNNLANANQNAAELSPPAAQASPVAPNAPAQVSFQSTTGAAPITCDDFKNVNIKTLKSYELEDGDAGSSSTPMRECVKLSNGKMKNLYKNGKPTGEQWGPLLLATDVCLTKEKDKDNRCDSTDLEKCLAKAAKCDAVAFIISEYDRDWTSPEHMNPERVKGGNPEIKCSARGIATIDYEGCAKFVQNGDIMDATQSALQTGQELYYKDQAMTAQMKAASSTESATAGLTALQEGVKGQEDVMNQRAALNTGKLAALASYYSEIPSYEDLSDLCSKYRTPSDLPANGCQQAVSNQQAYGLLENQPAKEKMKAKLAKVGIDVTSNLVMANLMSKRAGDIGNAIANVDSFKPIDPLAPSQDMQTTYCQTNPGDSKCLTGGLNRTFDAISDNVITFGEGGAGTIYQNNNPYADPTATATDSTTSPTNQKNITGVGSVIAAAHQNGGLETIAPAATVSKGTNPTGGGGGGGGSGAGSGGGGGGAPGAQPQGGTSAAIQGRTPTYGGGSGTLSMMGGFGINKNKSAGAKDDSNPFGKLFNKDGNKSGVVNFQGGRAPASVGNKGDNIFDMISKRYTTVSSDKRLLEYEMTK